MSRTAQDIIEIGKELAAARLHFGTGHGNGFFDWVEREFSMTRRLAQKFMMIANGHEGGAPYEAHLSFNTLYELAAPSTPEEVRTEVAERVATGETVTVADVRALKDKVRDGDDQVSSRSTAIISLHQVERDPTAVATASRERPASEFDAGWRRDLARRLSFCRARASAISSAANFNPIAALRRH